ncbi:hypothetical protein L198_01680 [Cryptococcus wingfieldii CBS 7118]|uniref:BSD domain-containing protein n=1 Tax=Cryptococcus wingfieldii CBS 7118 TaxID=1295528 RepID=A0A1E3JZY7_9TREE|nr:hypothetical protein L198_01680 [Cryptococcus wingfieldii CBS 7118]ODO06448.1 hypothetical protein L198_01680 [Cryptococcus wingfieldii CBS 7118]
MADPQAPAKGTGEPAKENTADAAASVPQPANPTPASQDAPESSSTPATDQNVSPTALQQSLNKENFQEEVGQVLGSFNSWWGGVKKQSASTFATIRADLDKTVTQAQADFEYLKTAKVEVVAKDPAQFEAEQEVERAKKAAQKEAAAREAASKARGKGKETDPAEDPSLFSAAFINRLTSSTSQLQNTLRTTLQSTIDAAAHNPALSNPSVLREQLVENLRLSSARENLQLSVKQAEKLAEEYLRKGDQWVKDAEKWMEDAVKVMPPDGEEAHGVSLGGDYYHFSTSGAPTSGTNSGAESRSRSPAGIIAAGSRKDALLGQLREDKNMLLVDPEGEAETDKRKAEFREWVKEHWNDETRKAGREDEALVGAVRIELVPEQLSDDQFWQRYLFHKHMIEAEEQKRKLILQATQQQEANDDFNWDDEEDSTPSVAAPAPSTTAPAADTVSSSATPKASTDGKLPSSAPGPVKSVTSVATSPRDSEESYDIVSDQAVKAKPAPPVETEDDEDSDWE